MSIVFRVAGAGMVIGGVLFFGRMAPIFAIIPDDMAFPPTTTEDLVRLALIAGPRWPLSHIVGLIAVGLFTAGYWAHARALAAAGYRLIGTAAAIVASIAFASFAVALIIDGFALPAAASEGAIASVASAHARALAFFTPAIFLMFVAMGIFSSRMLHGYIHSRWLGMVGMLVAIAGPTAYLFGVAGPNWDNLQIGGSLMMAGFFWHLLIGLAALFGRGIRV